MLVYRAHESTHELASEIRACEQSRIRLARTAPPLCRLLIVKSYETPFYSLILLCDTSDEMYQLKFLHIKLLATKLHSYAYRDALLPLRFLHLILLRGFLQWCSIERSKNIHRITRGTCSAMATCMRNYTVRIPEGEIILSVADVSCTMLLRACD
jgi:hypothetical protein